MKIYVVSKLNNSPRFLYATKFLFNRLLQIPFEITSELPDNYKNKIIIYYGNTNPNFFSVPETPGIFNINSQPIEYEHPFNNKLNAFFINTASTLGFDIFANIFFLLTEYESYYLPKDGHKRPQYHKSVRTKLDNFKKPLLHYQAELLVKKLNEFYNLSLKLPKQKYNIKITVDIDNAGLFLGRKIIRQFLSLAKKVYNTNLLNKHLATLLLKKDPVEIAIEKIINAFKDYEIIFFLLLNDKHKLDSLTSPNSKQWKKIFSLIKNYKIGLHPSYSVHEENELINTEIENFRKLTGFIPTLSRFHYLRKILPRSYNLLLKNNINTDFTTTTTTYTGFLHGTTLPFNWYDIQNETETKLKLVPTIFMDTTFSHQKLTFNEALNSISKIIAEQKKFGGTTSVLLHPETFTGLFERKDWDIEKLKEIISS